MIKKLDYFKLLHFIEEVYGLKYDLKDKNSFKPFYGYFKNQFKKDFFNLNKHEIFNNRLNEEQLILFIKDLINGYELKKQKSKEELIEILIKEKIDDVFSASCFVLLRNIVTHNISIKLIDEFGNYIKDNEGNYVYSNFLDQNFKRLISLYCTDLKDDNLDDYKIIMDKLFYAHELSQLEFIRDISTLKNTFYRLFVELKQI